MVVTTFCSGLAAALPPLPGLAAGLVWVVSCCFLVMSCRTLACSICCLSLSSCGRTPSSKRVSPYMRSYSLQQQKQKQQCIFQCQEYQSAKPGPWHSAA